VKHAKKHIDDLFREKLGDYAEVPPADAWGELDSRLDVLTPAVPHAPYHWLGHVGMVSVIAVLGVSVMSRFVSDKAGVASVSGTENVAKVEQDGPAYTQSAPQQQAADEVAVPSAQNESLEENASQGQVFAGATGAAGNTPASGAASNSTAGVAIASGKQHKGHKSVVRLLSKGHERPGHAADEPAQNNSGSSDNNSNKSSNSSDNQYNSEKSNSQKNNDVNTPIAFAKPLKKNLPDALAAAKEKANVDFPRWGAGVKVGYERGADNIAAKKVVVAPYLQYNISRKVAIIVQPAVKFANSPVRNISSRSYYAAKNDGTVTAIQNYVEPRAEGGVVDTYYFSRFRYTRSYDSIVKNETIGGRYLEFELPVMMRYSVAKNVSVYGGINMVFSQLSGVKQTTNIKTISKSADSLMSSRSVTPTPVAIDDIIKYDGTPISEYNGPLYPSSQVNHLRLGATVGVTYEYSNRWLLDALVQQTPAPKDMRGAYNINAPLSSTYFRLSVGYKLTK